MKQDHSSLQEQQLNTLYSDVRQIFETSRIHAVRSVDFCRVQMYWHLGQRIFKEEQQGKERADYGSYLIKTLAKRLEPEFGSGFGVRQLERARLFYRTYPIATTLRSQLNWSQYRSLIKIEDPTSGSTTSWSLSTTHGRLVRQRDKSIRCFMSDC